MESTKLAVFIQPKGLNLIMLGLYLVKILLIILILSHEKVIKNILMILL